MAMTVAPCQMRQKQRTYQLTLIAARPIMMFLKNTGNATSTVRRETLEGFCRPVVRGDTTNWLPPIPPLPVTETLPKVAIPPNPLMPKDNRVGNKLDQ
jgi:hypothetical protein